MSRTACLEVVSAVAVFLLLAGAGGAAGYIGLIGTPSDLDFFMRESFRGDEIDDRNFRYADEYFLNVLSFRHLSSSDAIWAAHTRGYRLALGSVTSAEFFLDHEAKIDLELGANIALHYRFVQAEDYDSRYFRHLVALSYRFSTVVRPYAYTQLSAFKEDIDIGGGLLVAAKPVQLNLGFVFPKAFLNTKSRTDERFERQAFGLGLVATLPVSERWRITVRLFQNFPLEIAAPREGRAFQFRRFVYGPEIAYRIDAASSLRWAVHGEDTEKEREFLGPRNVENARMRRFALRSMLVYSHAWQSATLLDTGIFFHRFREPTRFPLAPARTVRRERTEVLLFGQVSWRVWNGLSVVPGVFFGYVEALDRRPPAAPPETDDSVQAKVSLGLAYRFSEYAYLQLQPTFDLDQPRFGGAGAHFVATF